MGAAALAVAVALLVVGCGGGGSSSGDSGAKPKAGGTLRLSQGEEVLTLDPLEALDGFSVNLVSQINESLFKVNAEGKNEPWLLSNVQTSSDQRVWTLSLKDGVKFSDGSPMTSADVLFTFETAKKSPIWGSFFEADTFKAPSPTTFVIKSEKPAPELPAILSQWSFGIVPKDYGGVSEKEFAASPVGTGPFMLEKWKRGEAITLAKNPNYWDQGKPYLDKVVFQSVPNPQSRTAQLKGGQLDLISNPSWPQVASIESTPGLRFGEYALGYSQAVSLNNRLPLFQNPKVREAVYLALDREGMLKASVGDHGEPGGSWIPPAVPYHDTTIKVPARDLDKAKSLMAEAEGEGVDPTVTMLTYESSFWETAEQILQQNLEEIGFTVKVQKLDTAALTEALAEGEFGVAPIEAYDAIPSPSELFGLYNAYEGLYSGSDTTETERLAEEAVGEVDPGKREALWHEAQQVIENDKNLITVAYLPYAWAMRDDLAGFTVTTTGTPWLADAGFSE
ncbi:MAG TPA: ABC transporter substrate-binding protein [Solirubrobacterales bacterium]|nr:ABC transporter substrate-binding protein [Solirubrobacterales bacterium]